ncbi:MAG: transposase [Bacteroidales bacterium]|nr:transposase [Bacteroidales bacterium]
MSRKYKFRNHDGLYFISFATVNWIDLFIRNEYKEIILDSWRYCQKNKGLNIHAWVIMSNHIHMIISSGTNKLENIVRDMKSYTSTRLKIAISENPKESRRDWILQMMNSAGKMNGNNNNFQLWQQHNKPIELFNNIIMQQKLDYLHNNPVEQGIVYKPEDYVYSSAMDYCGETGLIDVVIIE